MQFKPDSRLLGVEWIYLKEMLKGFTKSMAENYGLSGLGDDAVELMFLLQ